MPVTFDNAASFVHSGVTATFPLTVGTKAVLLVYAGGVGSNFSVNTMEYAGNPMAFLGATGTGGTRFEVWGLTAPTAGVNNLSASMANDIDAWHFVAVSYQQVKAGNPFGTITSQTSSTATNFNFSISATTTDIVSVGFRSQFDLATTNATKRGSAHSAFAFVHALELAGAATVTISATESTTSLWFGLGVPLHFSAAGSVTPIFAGALVGCGR